MHKTIVNARFFKIFALIIALCIFSSCAIAEDNVLFKGYNDERLYIREGMSRETEKVGSYESFSIIEVLEDFGDWYRVKDGYVMSKYVYPLEGSSFEKILLGEAKYCDDDFKANNMPFLRIHYLALLPKKVRGECVTGGKALNFVGTIPLYDILDEYAYFPSGRDIFRVKISNFTDIQPVGSSEQIIACYRTVYFSSTNNRKYNIGLVSSIIDGTLVKSGKTFSYNKTTGPRGKKQGYKLANVSSGGKIIQDYGGGVCQVSSTIYAAIMNDTHFGIVSRKPHGLEVSYLPVGMDATVSYSGTDFMFKNNYPFSVKINISAKEGVCLVVIEKSE